MAEGGGEAQQEDVVLSEFHVGCPSVSSWSTSIRLAPAGLREAQGGETSSSSSSSSSSSGEDEEKKERVASGGRKDAEGDLVLRRRRRPRPRQHPREGWEEIIIEHAMATPLGEVGLQVWRGALLLVDWALEKASELAGECVVELGAGTGLAGIAAARTAGRVYLTDVGERVLANCRRNATLNRGAYTRGGQVVRVRSLDWGEALGGEWAAEAVEAAGDGEEGEGRGFGWSAGDLEELREATFVLAADCVYDDRLTERLVRCAKGLLDAPGSARGSRVLLVAMEKRFNFSLSGLDVRAHAYDHFLSFLGKGAGAGLVGRRLDVAAVPQRARYDRGQDLELWEVRSGGQADESSK